MDNFFFISLLSGQTSHSQIFPKKLFGKAKGSSNYRVVKVYEDFDIGQKCRLTFFCLCYIRIFCCYFLRRNFSTAETIYMVIQGLLSQLVFYN